MDPSIVKGLDSQLALNHGLQSQIHDLTNAMVCLAVAVVTLFVAFAIQTVLHERRIKSLEARLRELAPLRSAT